MKKYIYKICAVVLFTGIIASCEEDVVIYDGTSGTALASFEVTAQDFPVSDEGESFTLVEVNASTISNVDRTIAVSIDEESTALAAEYNIVASTLVIPANSFEGFIKITGDFNAIPESVQRTLVLNLDSVEGAVLNEDKDQITVTLFRGCPLPENFAVGNYLLEETTELVDGPTLESGTVVEVTQTDGNPFGRQFQTFTFPDYCSTAKVTFKFSLICGDVISSTNQGNCVCQQGQPFLFGPATVPGTYDAADDSVLFLAFTNDVTSNCGPPVQTIYKLTKQ